MDTSTEAIRLVIWDLDDTFWRGTYTEGGIGEYSQVNHDSVIELARRGIISTICSKNEPGPVLEVLRERGILEYFVMPSISWLPKGPRIRDLLSDFQLRPATALFIDDNPSNRAEALSFLPDLQVADETILSTLLREPRLQGKDDRNLTRLNQYRLLAQRHLDRDKSSASNEEFLRASGIRVFLDWDVASNLDRAIELVNRTNQLNFTKRRLPEDLAAASEELLLECSHFSRQAALVHVSDKYGDYGYVGFFVVESMRTNHVEGSSDRSLRHFCFSCRTLGMQVERWVYDYLGRPELRVQGNVLTDLSSGPSPDWITQTLSKEGVDRPAIRDLPYVTIVGGCDANPVSVYLERRCHGVRVIGNHKAGSLFVRVNSASIFLSSLKRCNPEFRAECDLLGIPFSLNSLDLSGAHQEQAEAFVFNFGLDAEGRKRFRHKIFGWEICLEVMGFPQINMLETPVAALAEAISRLRDQAPDMYEHALRVAKHLQENYESRAPFTNAEKRDSISLIRDAIPPKTPIVFLLDHNRIRLGPEEVISAKHVEIYEECLRDVMSRLNNVSAISFTDSISDDNQIQQGGNHYDRSVYLGVAERLMDALDPKSQAPIPGVAPESRTAE